MVENTITSYKGFDKNLECRGFKFEVSKTYTISGKVEACANGFHACEHPLDCFGYYAPATSRYFEVTQSGEMDRKGSDTKVASATITIGVELSIGDMVARAFKWVWDRATLEPGNQATGNRSAASVTGYQGAASVTGYQGAASVTGYQGAALASGNQGAALASGQGGAAVTTGFKGAAVSTGDQGAALTTGGRSAASATGIRGIAAVSGGQGLASATGNLGAALATGPNSAALVTGEKSCAASFGWKGQARAAVGGAIFLVCRDNEFNIICVRASKVGENGIKPDVWYSLSAEGEFLEVVPE